MRVVVTKEHIAAGRPLSEEHCPIALAIRRKPGFSKATVGHHFIFKDNHKAYPRFLMPIEVQTFINRFDSKQPVSPFSFDIEAINE